MIQENSLTGIYSLQKNRKKFSLSGEVYFSQWTAVTTYVIQELNNSVGINRFSDWKTSKDARELRIEKKLEYSINAPEL